MDDAVVEESVNRLEAGDWFLVAIVVLELGAVISYVLKRRWLEATVWACYGTATMALLLLQLKARP